MANAISSVKERLYIVKEVTFGTAVAPVNSNCCRFINATITPVQAEIQRPDKNADEDEPIGLGGRRSCTWSASMSMAGSGTNGQVPDCSALLEAAMGKAVSGTAYGMAGLIPSLSIWKYDQTGLAQVAIGAIVQQMRVNLSGDIPTLEFSGEAVWGYDSAQAADGNTPAAAKGGLGSWPTEPSAPVTNGIPPQAFNGTITLDGNTYSTFLSANITVATGRSLPHDGMNVYGTSPVTTTRSVTLDFGLKEDDSSNLISFAQKAHTKSPVNCSFAIGTTASTANIWTWTAKNMLLPAPVLDGSQPQRHINFSGVRAHPTSSGSYDMLALAIT